MSPKKTAIALVPKRGTAHQPTLGRNLFFNRSPIIDRAKRIFAYQLDFLPFSEKENSIARAPLDQVMLPAILGSLDPLSLSGGREAFVYARPSA